MNLKKINGTDKKVLSICEFKEFEKEKKKTPELYKKGKKKVVRMRFDETEDIEEKIMFGEMNKIVETYGNDFAKIYPEIDFLHSAAEYNSLISIKYLIEKVGLDVNKKDEKGFTPLQVAINEGNIEVVEYLLEKNVDIEEPDPEFYLNAFYLALQNGMETTEESKSCCYEIALLLLEKGAKVLEKYQDGNEDFPNIELIYNLKKESNKKARKLLAELKKDYKGWLK